MVFWCVQGIFCVLLSVLDFECKERGSAFDVLSLSEYVEMSQNRGGYQRSRLALVNHSLCMLISSSMPQAAATALPSLSLRPARLNVDQVGNAVYLH